MTLEKTLRWIVLGGIFLLPFVPFVVANSLFFPFITGKNFTFRIIVEVITAAWLALALVNTAYRPRREWLFVAFSIFILIIAAADLFGMYPFKSFWSNFERMDGWVTLAHLFAYFVVASTTLSYEKLWKRLFQVSLSISVLVGGHALLQLFGIASLNPGFSSTARLDASFGNPIYLAVYMLFHIFIAALLIADLYKQKSRNTYGWTLVYGSILIFDMLILFLTGTRGAMLGLIGGVLLTVFLFALRPTAPNQVRKIAVAFIAFIVLSAGSLYLMRDQEWLRGAPVLGRLATISLEDSTTKARIMNWGTAWKGVKERPLLGWGQENFAIVFNKYYNPNMYTQEQWFDRVHNVLFDWLIAGGFLGLFAYLALFFVSLWYIWRNKGMTFTPAEQSILTGLLAAYFFHNLFVFDNIVSYILFVTILSFIAFRANEGRQATPLLSKISFPSGALPIVAVAAVIGLWGTAWYVNADALATNKTLIRAISPQQEGLQKNFEYFEEAVSKKTFGLQEAREQLVQVAGQQLARNEAVSIEIKQKFLQKAADEMSQQAKDSPLDPRFPLFLGSLLNIYGFYNEAAPILAKAAELAPKKQTILYEVGTNAFARGDTNAGIAAFKEAHEAAPLFTEPRALYAAALIRAGKFAEADAILAPIVESGIAADPRVAAALIAVQRIDKIIPLWEARVRAMPKDIEARFLLAGTYGELKNMTKVKEHLDAAVAIDPSVKARAEQLMNEIRGVR